MSDQLQPSLKVTSQGPRIAIRKSVLAELICSGKLLISSMNVTQDLPQPVYGSFGEVYWIEPRQCATVEFSCTIFGEDVQALANLWYDESKPPPDDLVIVAERRNLIRE